MAKIEVYSKEWCPYCTKTKALLRSKRLDYQEVDITSDAAGELAMIERSRRRTVPQIFIDGVAIGGYDDLAQLNSTGFLVSKLPSTHIKFTMSSSSGLGRQGYPRRSMRCERTCPLQSSSTRVVATCRRPSW